MSTRPPQNWDTARLLLRPPRPADAEAILAGYARDAEVTKYLVWRPHTDLEETRTFVERCIDLWKSGSGFPWGMIEKTTGDFIGMVEMRLTPAAVNLGYVLARSRWNRGLMAEALQPVVEWCLAQPTIYRVWAVTDIENQRSARVLEKVGMQREGVLRRWVLHPNVGDEPRDCLCYARVK